MQGPMRQHRFTTGRHRSGGRRWPWGDVWRWERLCDSRPLGMSHLPKTGSQATRIMTGDAQQHAPAWRAGPRGALAHAIWVGRVIVGRLRAFQGEEQGPQEGAQMLSLGLCETGY